MPCLAVCGASAASTTKLHFVKIRHIRFTNTLLFGGGGMRNLLDRLWKEDEGQDLTEYGLLLVLIALAAIAMMQSLGSAINAVFSTASASMSVS